MTDRYAETPPDQTDGTSSGDTGDAGDAGAYGSTSGTQEREGRAVMEGLMTFALRDEIAALKQETQWLDGDRNARTLAKDIDFRALLSVMRPGAQIDEHDGDARASIQIVEGGATLTVDGENADLGEGQLAVVDAGRPWLLTAATDCAVLITLAWPREKAGV
jgi:quercetin dioxygenase-like cupin family protein